MLAYNIFTLALIYYSYILKDGDMFKEQTSSSSSINYKNNFTNLPQQLMNTFTVIGQSEW